MTSRKIAFLFPGQGSQFIGMGRDLAQQNEDVQKLFTSANALIGRDLTRIMFEGPEEELRQTINTQPALFVCAAGAELLLRGLGIAPAIVAGHSLGEYNALVSAGVLDFDTALTIVKRRGELMQEAGSTAPGAMAAVLGLDESKVTDLAAGFSGRVVVANYNAPDQIVISGEQSAVAELADKLKAAGAKRTVMLPVSGAFHSHLMEPASIELAKVIQTAQFAEPTVPVVTNADGRVHTDAASIKACLLRQMTSSVYWTRTIREMLDAGVTDFVEVGAGKVLSGLVKRIEKSATTHTAGAAAEIEQVAQALKQ